MDSIETRRLLLRPFEEDDGPALHGVVGNDPDMTWDHSVRSVEKVSRTVIERMSHFAEHGFGVWAVIEKVANTMVGQTGLQRLPKTEHVELVTYTAKRAWRLGYAHEACRASLRYGFEILGLGEIWAVVRKENSAGRGIVRKLGFQFVRDDVIYDANVEVSRLSKPLYQIDASEFYRVFPARTKRHIT